MTFSIDLSGRVAFITGASGGLGAQFARTLAAAGAGVVLASRRLDKLGYQLTYTELPEWGHAYTDAINERLVWPWFSTSAA